MSAPVITVAGHTTVFSSSSSFSSHLSLRNFRLLSPHIPGNPLCAHHHTADGLPAALTAGARERPWVGLEPQHHRINKSLWRPHEAMHGRLASRPDEDTLSEVYRDIWKTSRCIPAALQVVTP